MAILKYHPRTESTALWLLDGFLTLSRPHHLQKVLTVGWYWLPHLPQNLIVTRAITWRLLLIDFGKDYMQDGCRFGSG